MSYSQILDTLVIFKFPAGVGCSDVKTAGARVINKVIILSKATSYASAQFESLPIYLPFSHFQCTGTIRSKICSEPVATF